MEKLKPWDNIAGLCCGGISNPDWNKRDRVHCWKNHVPDELKEVWESLTLNERRIIAWMADRDASNEGWD